MRAGCSHNASVHDNTEHPPATALPIGEDHKGESWASDVTPKDLRRKTARGALASTGAQAATVILKTGSLMVLARLLLKEDFGLVNMVTAFTGFLILFRDAGLGMATVQSPSLTRGQTSTLFWVNCTLGAVLALFATAIAPLLAAFYGEPRLFWITVVLGASFIFGGAAVQHRAMLQRSMRFTILAAIDTASILISIAVAISMAATGCGYWALVAMTFIPPLVALPGVWLATGWIPTMPQRGSGTRSMLIYGSGITFSNFIYYVAYNADKVLIGRFLGAEAIGVYGRAYQLINLPTDNLNYAMGSIAFPALSRVQNDPARLNALFLKGYNIFVSVVLPIIIACALFADDIILVFLGPKWPEVARIFRLLVPTALAFTLVNPFSHFMLARGLAGRYLKIACVITPVLVLGYTLGLRNGVQGVALGFSTTLVLLSVPVMLWAKHGTLITMWDVVGAMAPSLTSITLGALATLALQSITGRLESSFARLLAESAILFGIYLFVLLFLLKQKPLYAQLLQDIGFRWPFGDRHRAAEEL